MWKGQWDTYSSCTSDAAGSAASRQPDTSEGNTLPECPERENIPAGPDIELLANLKEKNLAALGLMVIEGRIAIEKALDAGIVPRFLVCTEAEEEYWRHWPERAATRPDSAWGARRWENADTTDAVVPREDAAPQPAVPSPSAPPPAFSVYAMRHEALCALVEFKFHRGAIAVADVPNLAPFEGAGFRGEPRTVFLCLWDVTDPSNLGALIRTAAGLGAAGVLLGPGCASPYYRKTIRASMGNVFSIPLWRVDLGALEALEHCGVHVIAAALSETALTIETLSLRPWYRQGGPLVLILGNEGYGLPAEVLGRCTAEVCIPMARGVDSLNVAVAGGILMYEVLKNRPCLGIVNDRSDGR